MEVTKHEILTLVQEALQAAIQISDDYLPWWKLTQTPFQILCTLLSINEPDSLTIVSDALHAIEHVHAVFNTRRAQNANEAAQHMVRIALQRKERESLVLDKVCQKQVKQWSLWLMMYSTILTLIGRSS